MRELPWYATFMSQPAATSDGLPFAPAPESFPPAPRHVRLRAIPIGRLAILTILAGACMAGLVLWLGDIGPARRMPRGLLPTIVFALSALIAYLGAILYWRFANCRFLARFGTPALAQVIDKWKKTRATYRGHWAAIRFSANGVAWQVWTRTLRAGYRQLAVGHVVTVLYDPANPANCIIYACGEYEVIGI